MLIMFSLLEFIASRMQTVHWNYSRLKLSNTWEHPRKNSRNKNYSNTKKKMKREFMKIYQLSWVFIWRWSVKTKSTISLHLPTKTINFARKNRFFIFWKCSSWKFNLAQCPSYKQLIPLNWMWSKIRAINKWC